MTVARKPVTGESTKEAVKTIACGDAGRFRCTRCCSCAFYQYKLHTRPRVHWAPGIPHALFGRKINAQLGRIAPRDRETAFGIKIRAPSLRAKRSNPYLLSCCGHGLLRFARNDGGDRHRPRMRAPPRRLPGPWQTLQARLNRLPC